MSKKIETVVIVGGGSSGWMTATTLVSQFPDKKITLIESPNIATVGVGESTVGGINNWMQLVGIEGDHFMPHTDGTYKLSISFEDFYRKGSGTFHYPFGRPYLEGNKSDLNDWYFKKMLYPETPVSDYAECHYPQMALVSQNKIFKNENGILPGFNFLNDTAYQFDATKFGLWLKDHYCLPKGVHHILSEVKDVTTNVEGIEHLILQDGSKIAADLFIDCTGFTSLLMDKTLKEPFDSYEDILPNNSAWATRIPYTDKEKELTTYTNCTAISNGWVWNIPLWSRIGSGYVYSDRFITDEEALIEFKDHLIEKGYKDVEELEYKKLKMRIGLHKRLWVKNVCTIGLSAGFIEPLESNGLLITHELLFYLVRTLQRGYISRFDKDNFTAICKSKFREVAEFVSFHFALSHRDDSEYWREIANREFEPILIEQKAPSYICGFNAAVFERMRGFHFANPRAGIHCIAAGLNWAPTDMPSLIYDNCNSHFNVKKEFEFYINQLDKRKNQWKIDVSGYQSPYEYLKSNFNYED